MNYIQSLRRYIGTKPIIAPGSAVIVFNGKGELLLQLRSDTLDWGIPGGGMELVILLKRRPGKNFSRKRA
jgi:8-oxo-dGTP pyrophosphatase MutT (NUDIX family)